MNGEPKSLKGLLFSSDLVHIQRVRLWHTFILMGKPSLWWIVSG